MEFYNEMKSLRAVCSILFDLFSLKNISHVFSGDYTRISAPRWHEGWCNFLLCIITVSGGWHYCFLLNLEFFRVDSYIYYICDITWKLIQKCYIMTYQPWIFDIGRGEYKISRIDKSWCQPISKINNCFIKCTRFLY